MTTTEPKQGKANAMPPEIAAINKLPIGERTAEQAKALQDWHDAKSRTENTARATRMRAFNKLVAQFAPTNKMGQLDWDKGEVSEKASIGLAILQSVSKVASGGLDSATKADTRNALRVVLDHLRSEDGKKMMEDAYQFAEEAIDIMADTVDTDLYLCIPAITGLRGTRKGDFNTVVGSAFTKAKEPAPA